MIKVGPEVLFDFKEDFEINSAKVQASQRLKEIALKVDSVLSVDSVTAINIRGYASIDGPTAFNRSLAKGRAKAMGLWLTKATKVDPSMIKISYSGEDWKMFDSLVNVNPEMPKKAEIINIIHSNKTFTQKQNALKALGQGIVWKYLCRFTLPEMRVAEVTIGGYTFRVKIDEVPVEEVVENEFVEVVLQPEAPLTVVEEEPFNPVESEEWVRKFYIKTNAPAWLMLWTNIGFEIDLAPHWSFAVPVYYSGWDYFKSTLKFRTFSVVPEVRYWLRPDNMGFFVNGHLGLNQFNYADGGSKRYQTYHGHSPALGGGVGIGYRWYFCGNHNWSMEAGLGAGVYHLDYSIFENIPNGLIIGRRIKTFFGIDQASLSFVYSFGVERKEVNK